MPPTRQSSLRLPPDVEAWLKKKAAEDQRSLAFIVTTLVREQMTREAKAKARAKAAG